MKLHLISAAVLAVAAVSLIRATPVPRAVTEADALSEKSSSGEVNEPLLTRGLINVPASSVVKLDDYGNAALHDAADTTSDALDGKVSHMLLEQSQFPVQDVTMRPLHPVLGVPQVTKQRSPRFPVTDEDEGLVGQPASPAASASSSVASTDDLSASLSPLTSAAGSTSKTVSEGTSSIGTPLKRARKSASPVDQLTLTFSRVRTDLDPATATHEEARKAHISKLGRYNYLRTTQKRQLLNMQYTPEQEEEWRVVRQEKQLATELWNRVRKREDNKVKEQKRLSIANSRVISHRAKTRKSVDGS